MEKPTKYFYLTLAVILLAGAVSFHAYGPALANPYHIISEMRLHVYWTVRYQDHQLFANDLLTQFAKAWTPWGYAVLFYFISQYADPVLFAHVLSILLVIITAVYLFKLLRYVHSPFAGFLTGIVFLFTPYYLQQMAGGLPQSFAFPLLVMFLYHLVKKEYHLAAISAILQGLFYPIVLMPSMLTFLLTFGLTPFGDQPRKNLSLQTKYFFIALVLGAVLVGGQYARTPRPEFNRGFTKKEMLGRPEFGKGGRWYGLLPVAPVGPRIRDLLMEGGVIAPLSLPLADLFSRHLLIVPCPSLEFDVQVLILMVFLFILIETWRTKLRFPAEALFLLISGALMYWAADFFLLRLYLPDRYILFIVPIAGLILFCLAWAHLLSKVRPVPVRVVLQTVLVVFLVFVSYGTSPRVFMDVSAQKPLYETLSALPSDIMIAAHPQTADNIPIFAKRKVFVNYETSLPVYAGYWDIVRQRTFDFFDAYYAAGRDEVKNFCLENRIDYLVVDLRHFVPEYLREGRFYFEPFNAHVVRLVSERTGFALTDIPEDMKIFQDGPVYVLDVKRLDGENGDGENSPEE